jgi:hypothetical protein
MNIDPSQYDQHLHSIRHGVRPKGPRFAVLLLVIMAIMSLVLALVVAYVLI